MQNVLQKRVHHCIIMIDNRTEFFDFDRDDLVFEWDSNKDAANFKKHGIHFSTAVKVFLDPDIIIREDLGHSREFRFDAIGKAGKILFVVCTVRGKDAVRLISARKANAQEKAYYEYCKGY